MTTDAALLRKILHTLGRPTQAELDAGLAAVQRMEETIDRWQQAENMLFMEYHDAAERLYQIRTETP